MEAAEEVARLNGGIASTRAVGALATELIGAKLDEERARVQEAIESLGQREMGEALMPVARDGSSGSMSLPGISGRRMITGMHSESGTGMMPVILSGQHTLPAMVTPAPQPSGGSGIKMLVVALLLVAFVGGGLLAWQVANRPTPTAQPLGPSTTEPAVAATPTPTPDVAPDTAAVAAASPDTAPQDGLAPDTETAEAGATTDGMTVDEAAGRTGGRRPRGGTTATAGTTTETAATTAAEPAMTSEPAATPPAGMDSAPAEMTGFSFGTNPYLR
jgi:hypothetical protein